MRYLLWMAGIISVMSFVAVLAEAASVQDKEPPAKIASKASQAIPTSSLDPVPVLNKAEVDAELPASLWSASVEVGFSQDGEPEPHLLAVAARDRVELYQVEKASRKIASAPVTPPENSKARAMPPSVFAKRLHQIVDDEGFFTKKQPKFKRGCKDRYTVRIKYKNMYKQRTGCANQHDDPYAVFAQLFFRDAFIVWTRSN